MPIEFSPKFSPGVKLLQLLCECELQTQYKHVHKWSHSKRLSMPSVTGNLDTASEFPRELKMLVSKFPRQERRLLRNYDALVFSCRRLWSFPVENFALSGFQF